MSVTLHCVNLRSVGCGPRSLPPFPFPKEIYKAIFPSNHTLLFLNEVVTLLVASDGNTHLYPQALGDLRQEEDCQAFKTNLVHHSEFQNRQDYIVRPCLKSKYQWKSIAKCSLPINWAPCLNTVVWESWL